MLPKGHGPQPLLLYEKSFMLFENGFNAFAKKLHVCKSGQAEIGRNFSSSINFLHVRIPFLIMIQSIA